MPLEKVKMKLVDNLSDGKFRNFITAEVAAARYGRAPKSLSNDRATGEGLPFYKHGRTVLYDADECDAISRITELKSLTARSAAFLSPASNSFSSSIIIAPISRVLP